MTQSDEEQENVALFDGPLTIRKAMQCMDAKKWEQAMQEEYKSLMAKGMWELTLVPQNCSPIGSKWVFRAKRDAREHVVRYKAQLVAKGFAQVHRVDVHETFASMAKFTTIRYILATVYPCNWGSHGLGNRSNGCENGFPQWQFGGRHLYGATRGFDTRK